MKILIIYSLRIYEPLFKENTNTLNISKIRLFESFIEKHYKELKSVSDFAEKLNISANYLNVICIETVGKTGRGNDTRQSNFRSQTFATSFLHFSL